MYGMGETASAYKTHALMFAEHMIWAGQFFADHPNLCGVEASIKPGRIDLVTIGFNGVLRDWTRALPPIVAHDTGFFPLQSGLGMEDVLKTGITTVHVRRPL